MHKLDSPETTSSALRLYLDESGGKDPNTPDAVLGGLIIRRDNFESFEENWDRLLADHGIEPPLHMKEFGLHGKLGKMSACCKHQLFEGAAYLIKSHRAKSISASISNEEYTKTVSRQVGDRFGVYGMCFILAAYLNHVLAEANSYSDRVPFILDTGNSHKHHVVESHAWMIESQNNNGEFWHVGSLTFEDDKNFGILQAADIIAWSARRRLKGFELPGYYAPLNKLFDEHHVEEAWNPELIGHLADRLSKFKMPS
jgi:hypothetical protein